METTAHNRTLGRSGIEVSALGFGCWAIGGEWQSADGQPLGWGKVDDEESVRAIRRALDLGVTFFDTADAYGTGHSERLLGRALGKHRTDVVIATKWGNLFDERTRIRDGQDDSPEHLRRALTASLRRLNTDHVDLYQLHISDADPERAAQLRDVCEELVGEGLIRAYAWSTDDPARAAVFAQGPHCAAVQHRLNILQDAPELLALCAESDLASINRSPLAMGLLTGKHTAGRALDNTDIRNAPPPGCRASSRTRARTRPGSSASTPCGPSSPATAAPSPRAPSPGSGPAARGRSRSPVSVRSPRPRRTRAPSRRDRSPPGRWRTSTGSWGAERPAGRQRAHGAT